jgi:3-hydroxyisobutyrate dehydrogenase-like beta-hydroxyacid dehydrogenase
VAQASDVVITMLPASPEVEGAVVGPDGILANGRAGQVIVDMSTVEPKTTDLIAKAAADKGLSVVDAPVGRSPRTRTAASRCSWSAPRTRILRA